LSYHRMQSKPSSPLAVLVTVVVLFMVALAGCAAGNVATTATGGVGGQVGDIVVRDAQFTFDVPVAGETVYQPGDSAALQLTIVNEGNRADRLVRVTSPIARAGTITEIPGFPATRSSLPAIGIPLPRPPLPVPMRSKSSLPTCVAR
jgi:copper(I)-binding protein